MVSVEGLESAHKNSDLVDAEFSSLKNILSHGLDNLEIVCDSDIQDKLITYIYILKKWNRIYNLSGIRELEKMVTYHLLDSLSILPYIKGPQILDIGSGAGLPGIPLALLLPANTVTLVDSNSKKTRFMQNAVSELGIKNSRVLHTRIENESMERQYDTVISRAFATVNDMLCKAGRLCKPDGQILAMKGAEPTQELANLIPG